MGGAGAKAIGERKRVLGKLWLRNEPMDQEREIKFIGKLEPIFPRKCKRNGTRPKALKIHPTQNGRGRSTLYIGLRNMVAEGVLESREFGNFYE